MCVCVCVSQACKHIVGVVVYCSETSSGPTDSWGVLAAGSSQLHHFGCFDTSNPSAALLGVFAFSESTHI